MAKNSQNEPLNQIGTAAGGKVSNQTGGGTKNSKDYWTYNKDDNTYTHVLNGKGWTVTANDPKFATAQEKYNSQQSGAGSGLQLSGSGGKRGSRGSSSAGPPSGTNPDDYWEWDSGKNVYTHVLNGNRYDVYSGDSRFQNAQNSYNNQFKYNGVTSPGSPTPGGMAATQDGGLRVETPAVNSVNQNDYWTYDQSTGSYWHYLDGIGYEVTPGDSLGRYDDAAAQYAAQNGGMAAGGTYNDPTGWSMIMQLMGRYGNSGQEAIQQATEAALAQLQASREDSDATYNNANKAAYLNMMGAQKNIAQQLAATGLGKTGASESILLGNQSQYSGAINSNEQARATAARDIYNQMAQVEAQAGLDLSELQYDQTKALIDAYQAQLAGDREQANLDRDYQREVANQNTEEIKELANSLITMGAPADVIISVLRQAYPDLSDEAMVTYIKELEQRQKESEAGKAQAVADIAQAGATTAKNNYQKALYNKKYW